ncbi:prohead protease/major capsid protein fusion protein [Archangium violaceum]|uniref:prohead protease/major capsid protein fusion protein n=1 Tax=Archangium violaceum TaxID=83451 RepID=UPI0036DF9CC8
MPSNNSPTPALERRDSPPLMQRGAFVPSTFDEKAGTVEVTWTTGARGLRSPWYDDDYWEELEVTVSAVNLSRLNNGAPFLADHNGYSIRGVIGVVERAWIVDGEGRAVVRFSDRADVKPIREDVRNGILQHISVGYSVQEWRQLPPGPDGIAIKRAVRWTPAEISLVPMGFDDAAKTRSAPRGHVPQNRTTPVDDETNPKNTQQQQTNDTQAERERATTILNLCQRHNFLELGAELVANGTKLVDAREMVLARAAERSEEAGPHPWPSGAVERGQAGATQRGGHDDFTAAAVDALVMRAGIHVAKPHPAAADLRHVPALELARTALSRSGKRVGFLAPAETIKRAMTTSDFPLILTGAIGASVRQGYEAEPASHRAWVRTETVPDFREQVRPILGSAPGLEPIAEMGEYPLAGMSEDSAAYRVTKFGRALALSWELLVNDRLNAFLRVQPALGQAARRKEADLVYSLLSLNSGAGPTMQDGNALFHASHSNDVTGGLDVAGFGKARAALRKQTAVGGGFLALVPRYVIIPAEYETDLDVLLASTTRTKSSTLENDTPDWMQRLVPVVEPRLSTGAYFLAADSGQIDTLVLAMLEENAGGPVIEEETEFSRDAHNWKVRHVIGAKALDWRGLIRVKNS